MTLRVKVDEEEVAREKEEQMQENIRLVRFTDWIKDIRKYLCLQHGDFFEKRSFAFVPGVPVIIVGDEQKESSYINTFRNEMENTIFSWNENNDEYYEYNRKIYDQNWWTRFQKGDGEWELRGLKDIIEKLNHEKSYDLMYTFDCYALTTPLKHYIIFWNLFLAAMDDDIYNEQLATVAELAACFGFDESMMRDWCRAVEYVFAGNKLSEDCDLECETVEGARFFLHKEE